MDRDAMTTHAEDVDAKLGRLLVGSVEQTRRNRRTLRWVVASVVLYVSLSTVGWVKISDAQRASRQAQRDLRRQQIEFCVTENASRSAQLQLWGPVLAAPRAPLPADATREERKAYDDSTQARATFQRTLHDNFDPVKC